MRENQYSTRGDIWERWGGYLGTLGGIFGSVGGDIWERCKPQKWPKPLDK